MNDIQTPPSVNPEQPPLPVRRRRGSILGGMVLVAVGLIFMLKNYFPGVDWDKLWPILLIVIGLATLWDGYRK